MLGKTHMSLGALGAVAVTPLFLHSTWETLPQSVMHLQVHHGVPDLPKGLLHEVEWVVSALIGSLLPDFDEQNSLMARRAERVVQFVLVLGIIALLWLMKAFTSPVAWVIALVVALGLLTRANAMRRIALGGLGLAGLYMSFEGHLPVVSSLLLAGWCVGAMFTSHRTFTHSILGWIALSLSVYLALGTNHLQFMAIGVSVGYLLHMLADIPSGGVALAWPVPLQSRNGKWISPRVGVHLVQTGGVADHLIGAGAAILFLIRAVF